MPANERIAKVPRKLLTARGTDAHNFRREMLQGAVIVMVTAGYRGKRFILERAKELGVRTVVLDNPGSWAEEEVKEGLITKFVAVDMSKSSGEVYEQAMSAINGLENDPAVGKPDGIATFNEIFVPLTSRLAEALGLPGLSPDAVDLARDKHKTRGALKAAGLPTPPNHLITCAEDLAAAARTVGFPSVMKPVSGAASMGVKKVDCEADLVKTFEELEEELSGLFLDSKGNMAKDKGKKGGVLGAVFMLERYLDGAEVDVDVVMSEGEWVYAAVSDNGPTLEPYFNETWAVSPSLLPREQQVALKELAIGSVQALGFESGVFHVECKYTSIGPHLIEVNSRMGGGPVRETNWKVWNCDLVEETLFAALAIPSRPDVPKKPVQAIANSDVNALRSGKLVDLDFLEPLKGREGVVSFNPKVQAGADLVGPADGLPTWLVEIVVSRPTAKEALDFLLQLEKEIQSRIKLA